MKSYLRPISLVLLAVALWVAPEAQAQNLVGRPSSGLFGIKVGVISRMNLEGIRPLHTEIGSTAQVFADFPKGRDFYFVAAFDFYYVEISRSNTVMIEPSLGLKRAFYLRHLDMVLKPGASIGFAYLAEMRDLPASNYLTFKLLFEVHFKIDAKKAWVGELAFFNAPSGKAGKLDMSLGPGLMLRWGLAFR